jgi:hypothetical protein
MSTAGVVPSRSDIGTEAIVERLNRYGLLPGLTINLFTLSEIVIVYAADLSRLWLFSVSIAGGVLALGFFSAGPWRRDSLRKIIS